MNIKKQQDLSFGLSNEKKQKNKLENHFGILTKTKDIYDHFDYFNNNAHKSDCKYIQGYEKFNNKTALVATHSGGDGFRFLTAFRIQLEYLGVTVYSRSITVSNSKPYDEDKVKKILANYLELIK